MLIYFNEMSWVLKNLILDIFSQNTNPPTNEWAVKVTNESTNQWSSIPRGVGDIGHTIIFLWLTIGNYEILKISTLSWFVAIRTPSDFFPAASEWH